MGHFAHHLITALPTPLLPFIRSDFNLDYTQSALVLTAFSLANGFSQLPGGWLADRINPRILVTIGISGLAVAAILVGISHTFFLMLVFLILMGLMAGGYHPAAAPLVSASVEPQHRGRALGIHVTGSSASFFLTPLVAAAIAAAWGWRMSFIAAAIPVAIFGLILYRLLGKHTHRATKEVNVLSPFDESSPPPPRRWRRLIVFLVLSILSGALLHTVVSFIPLYLVDHFEASKQAASSFISIQSAAGFWGAPLGGYLSDRFGKIPVILTACFIAGACVYLLNLAPGSVVIGVLLFIIGIVTYTRMPVSESFILSHTTGKNRSTIYGIYYFATQETSAMLAPVLGILIDHFGFHTTFTIVGITVVATTLVCGVFLWGSRGEVTSQ